MNIELNFIKEENPELFEQLNNSALSENNAFALDFGDFEYIALPYQMCKTDDRLRVNIEVIECE